MKKIKLWLIELLLISIVIGFGVNYVFYEPTEMNAFIASKIYKAPANNYFKNDYFYKLVVDAYNLENGTSIPYTTNLSLDQLKTIKSLTLECELEYDYDTWEQYCKEGTLINDLSGLEKLTSLDKLEIYGLKLQTIDVSMLTSLISLSIIDSNIENIDLSRNTELAVLTLSNNKLTSLDVSKNLELIWLDVDNNNLLASLDLTNNTKLDTLYAVNTAISTIDVSKNTLLKKLYLGEEMIQGMGCPEDECELPVYQSYITNIDLSNNKLLEELAIDNAPIERLNLSNNTKLQVLSATSTLLTSLDVSNNLELVELQVGSSKLNNLELGNVPLLELGADLNNLTALNFNEYQNQLIYLSLNGNPINSLDISNLTKLESLVVTGTNLNELDVSKNTNLKYFAFGENFKNNNELKGDFDVTNINLENNTSLEIIYISGANIADLDLSKNVDLEYLVLQNMPITELDLSKNTNVSILYIANTEIKNLNLVHLEKIESLGIINSPIDNLTFGNISELYGLLLNNTNIKQIDLRLASELSYLEIFDNSFGEELYIYKGGEVSVNNTVKLPESYKTEGIVWESKDTSKATVTSDGVVSTLTSGIVNIVGTVKSKNIYYGEYEDEEEYFDVYTTTSVVNIIEIGSDKYIIDEENSQILINDTDEDVISDNIIVPKNIDLDIDLDNKTLKVKYKDNFLKTFDLVNVDLGGNITSDENILLDDSIIVNENKKYFSHIDFNTTVSEMKDMINTTGEIIIMNKDNEVLEGDVNVGTGSSVMIKINDDVYKYTIIIYGDVIGDGVLNLFDVMKMANYVYVSNDSLKGVYKDAADYNNDKVYDIKDIMQSARKIYNNQ